MRYEVDADIYEGSLSLLVELTKANLVDVFLIKLVDLTEQYLEQVKRSGIELNELAEPLPLLGMLVAIKARGLLPQPPMVDEEDVPVSLEELERRLKEYEQFKTVAQLLAELHALQHKHFGRAPAACTTDAGDAAAAPAPAEVSLTDLMGAFGRVLKKAGAPIYEVNVEPWTVEMKFTELRVLLTVKRHVRFLDIFTPEKSKLELVVTFLALLELIRQRIARAIQESSFSDITITVVSS
ncbi:MAG: segregation/condensation protein A [Candidatus Omnitrophica bacterium]|nr:segregation/condensation protein A [Candidatus Omnitrophota bacterium]